MILWEVVLNTMVFAFKRDCVWVNKNRNYGHLQIVKEWSVKYMSNALRYVKYLNFAYLSYFH